MVLLQTYIVSEDVKNYDYFSHSIKKIYIHVYIYMYFFSIGFSEPIISLPLQYFIMISSEVFIDQTQEGRNFSNYYNYYFNSIILLLIIFKAKIFILMMNFF